MIETDRLIVRPFMEADYQDLFEYLSDPIIYIFEPGQPISLSEAKEIASKRAKGSDFWAVELKQNHKLIGHLFFKQIEPDYKMTWELGYIFNPKYYKHGYASEASRAIVLFAFQRLKAHRIMARCDPNNTPSWQLLERIGFTREGHFKKCGCFRKDELGMPIWHDAYEYSLLDEDVEV
jgi:ribosomal-protein-alanine N-acetyltransferase